MFYIFVRNVFKSMQFTLENLTKITFYKEWNNINKRLLKKNKSYKIVAFYDWYLLVTQFSTLFVYFISVTDYELHQIPITSCLAINVTERYKSKKKIPNKIYCLDIWYQLQILPTGQPVILLFVDLVDQTHGLY